MTATPLPGMPEPSKSDYDTWAESVRPTFVIVAGTGESFVCWRIAQSYSLADPPNPARDWARFMGQLHHDGVVRYDGFGLARDKSAVRRWRGTRAALDGRAA